MRDNQLDVDVLAVPIECCARAPMRHVIDIWRLDTAIDTAVIVETRIVRIDIWRGKSIVVWDAPGWKGNAWVIQPAYQERLRNVGNQIVGRSVPLLSDIGYEIQLKRITRRKS